MGFGGLFYEEKFQKIYKEFLDKFGGVVYFFVSRWALGIGLSSSICFLCFLDISVL